MPRNATFASIRPAPQAAADDAPFVVRPEVLIDRYLTVRQATMDLSAGLSRLR